MGKCVAACVTIAVASALFGSRRASDHRSGRCRAGTPFVANGGIFTSGQNGDDRITGIESMAVSGMRNTLGSLPHGSPRTGSTSSSAMRVRPWAGT